MALALVPCMRRRAVCQMISGSEKRTQHFSDERVALFLDLLMPAHICTVEAMKKLLITTTLFMHFQTCTLA